MFLRLFLILLLSFNMLFVGCKKKAQVTKSSIPENINTYNNNVTYQKGNLITYNNKVYQAATTVRKNAPSIFTLVSRSEVFNPWLSSSVGYAQTVLGKSFDVIENWSDKEIYTVDDIVLAGDGLYYRAMFYNVDKNPINNKNTDSSLYGIWREIITADALAMYMIKGYNAKLVDASMSNAININASNTVLEILPIEGSTVLQKPIAQGEKPTVPLSENIALAYKWSYDTVYVENNVCTYGQKYYRAKWWNKGDTPRNAIFNHELWDTSWQEITSDLFRQLYKENISKGKQQVNDIKYVDPAEEYVSSRKGYIKEWVWDDIIGDGNAPLPSDVNDDQFENLYMAKIKKNFSDSALVNDIINENSDVLKTLIGTVLSVNKWDTLFPNKNDTYYSYNNFIKAIDLIIKYAYLTVTHTSGDLSYKKIFVLNKTTKNIRLISQSDYFHNGSTAANVYSAKYDVLNFAKFLSDVENNDKLRILSAFLAHCSYQSSSYWSQSDNTNTFNQTYFSGVTFDETFTNKYYKSVATGTIDKLNNKIAFSMIKNEDTKYEGSTFPNFVNYSREFPAVKDKSYHGRGPYLIKGSDTYALLSGIIFGRTDILLKDPTILQNGSPTLTNSFHNDQISGGTLGFLTALMSFMMNKENMSYSVNDVLVLNDPNGVYDENKVKINKDRDKGQSGFGWTVNIINGSEEANKDYRNERANNYNPALGSRVLHYTLFVDLFKAKTDESEKLDTLSYTPY